MWWRGLVILAYKEPSIVSASIDHVRRNKTPTRFLRTDAAKTIGGGGYVSLTQGGESLNLGGDAIRWTRREMECFIEMGVSINVLEFFASVYFVMLWSDHLEGHIVFLESDNTSAVAWLTKKRSARSPHADALARIFNVFCLSHNICIISRHIKGDDNTIADFLSRDLKYAHQDLDELDAGTKSGDLSKKDTLRKLLLLSVTEPEQLLCPRILFELTRLRTTPGKLTAP
jgi:hypothetical protein